MNFLIASPLPRATLSRYDPKHKQPEGHPRAIPRVTLGFCYTSVLKLPYGRRRAIAESEYGIQDSN